MAQNVLLALTILSLGVGCGIEEDSINFASHCSDQGKNGDGADTNCGGSCPLCEDGTACEDSSDCKSGECDDSLCGGGLFVSFDDVWPIFMNKCGSCHTTSSAGAHQIGNADINTAFTSSQKPAYSIFGTKGEAALFRILEGTMPLSAGCIPGKTDDNPQCTTAEERALIEAWLNDGQLGPL